mgnify:CR=1 FL=1
MKRLILLLGWFFFLALPAFAVQVVTGSYTGNGADNRNITISPACQPLAVFIQRSDAAWIGQVYFSSMSTNSSGEFTGTAQAQADRIQQFNSDGFQLGTQSYVNSNGSDYRYAALCDNGANDIAVGTYAGNASDNRDITISPAFSPEFVAIITSTSTYTAWRGANSHTGDSASIFNVANAEVSNYIQAFNVNGFQVGTGFNANTINYYYLAIKGSASGVATGSFTGNATDNRDITAPNFQPKLVFIKGNSATSKVASRFGNTGDASFCGDNAEAADIIQSLIATGFQVGTSSCSNENAVAMRWAAFTDVSAAADASFGFYRRRVR